MKKNIKGIGYRLWVMVVLFVSAPLTAQNTQEWQSTSAMQGSGSVYSSQVTAVGAAAVVSEASTTDSYSSIKAPSGPRRISPTHGAENPNPIGDAMLPLLLMAAGFGLYTALRRRKKTA